MRVPICVLAVHDCEVAQVRLRPVMNTIHNKEQHGLPRT
jgi:hypothetical protein